MNKYKVHNNNNFVVGIRFQNTGHEKVIQPRAFVYMDEEEIHYVNSVSKLFSKGVIYTDDMDMHQSMGYIEKNPNTISEEEVKEILKMGNAKMKKELVNITERHAINKVFKVIRESDDLDLTQSKLKIIGDVFEIENIDDLINDELT